MIQLTMPLFQKIFLVSLLFWAELYASGAEERAAQKKDIPVTTFDTILQGKEEPRISKKYFLGSYLIYNCTGRYFACVNSAGFDSCASERREDKEKNRVRFSCAPLKLFKTQEKCFKEQEKQIHVGRSKAFCLNTIKLSK